jgi:hypothetical protein
MWRVAARLRKDVEATVVGSDGVAHASPYSAFHELIAPWPEPDRVRLLIDLAFTDPFWPYELRSKAGDLEKALRTVAGHAGLDPDVVGAIQDTRKRAAASRQHANWAKIAAVGVGGLAIVGTGAYLAAPLIGTALGSAAGLSGAAATAHGLALLGGGSLASGGAGMAGGLWLVTGVGGATGLVGGAGSATLYAMGSKQAQVELYRLMVTFKMTLQPQQTDVLKAQEVIHGLNQRLRDLGERLDEERQLNDDNSARIKDLEAMIKAIEDTLAWMNDELDDTGDEDAHTDIDDEPRAEAEAEGEGEGEGEGGDDEDD